MVDCNSKYLQFDFRIKSLISVPKQVLSGFGEISGHGSALCDDVNSSVDSGMTSVVVDNVVLMLEEADMKHEMISKTWLVDGERKSDIS